MTSIMNHEYIMNFDYFFLFFEHLYVHIVYNYELINMY